MNEMITLFLVSTRNGIKKYNNGSPCEVGEPLRRRVKEIVCSFFSIIGVENKTKVYETVLVLLSSAECNRCKYSS